MSLEQRREAWSSYWASGKAQSCIGGLVDRDGGAVRSFWGRAVADLVPGARVLDIATGNGSLPRLILDIHSHDLHIDAVDAARLQPEWMDSASTNKVTFHPGVAMEALSFPSQYFDLVVSQFGIEYGQWPAALEQAARVCKPDGSLALLLHHAESLVVRLGRIEAAHQQYLLGPDGLVAAAQSLLPHLSCVLAGAAPDMQANTCRAAYNQAMNDLALRLGGEAPDLLLEARQHVHAIMAAVRGGDFAIHDARLKDYRNALELAALRTRELLQCALSPAQVQQMVAYLENQLPGRKLTFRALHVDGQVLGWGVLAVPE